MLNPLANVPTLQGNMAVKAPPKKSVKKKWPRRLAAVGVLTLIVIGSFTGYMLTAGTKPVRADLILHTVAYEPLSLTVVERGTLESSENKDVVCKVKAKSGGQAASSIRWVIDDGTQVKKDQLLMELDSSAAEDQLRVQRIALDTAQSAMIKSAEDLKIAVSQNRSDIATAEINKQLAIIDLEKYIKGDYEQSDKDINGRIKLAISDLKQAEDRLRWSDRMAARGYISGAQAEADKAKRDSTQVALDKAQEELRILVKFTKLRTEKDLSSKIEEATRALDRVKQQSAAKEIQAMSEESTKKSVYFQEVEKLRDIEELIANCTILAPQDGMVVYYMNEQARFGGGSNTALIAQGEPVREGQKLMRIPNLEHMMVNTKVHESMVSRIRGDKWVQTGFGDAIRATMLWGNLDALSSYSSQHAFTDYREKIRDREQKLVRKGHPATIRIDAHPSKKYQGRIKTVATVSSQQDWMSSDVKVYQTFVSIDDEDVEGLKPGMSAEVTILVENLSEKVLTLPIQAILGGSELGNDRKCLVNTPNGPEERTITLGLSNDRLVEIKSGLEEGDQVVVNPKVVVGERFKTRDQKGGGEASEGGKKRGAGKSKGGEGGAPGGVPGGPPGAGGMPKGGPGGGGRPEAAPANKQ